jgi:hypothetical protein
MKSPYEKVHKQAKRLFQDQLIAGEGSLAVRLAGTLESLVETIDKQSLPEALRVHWQDLITIVDETIFAMEPLSSQKKLVAKFLNFYELLTVACYGQTESAFQQTSTHAMGFQELNGLLMKAIQNQRKMSFDYQGHHREGDVYIYGTSPSGKKAIQLYQTAGTSSTGTLHQFKYYLLESMRHVQLLETPFTPVFERLAPYDPESSFFEEVFEKV